MVRTMATTSLAFILLATFAARADYPHPRPRAQQERMLRIDVLSDEEARVTLRHARKRRARLMSPHGTRRLFDGS